MAPGGGGEIYIFIRAYGSRSGDNARTTPKLGLPDLICAPRRLVLLGHSRHRPAMQMSPGSYLITLNAGPQARGAAPASLLPETTKYWEKVGFVRPPQAVEELLWLVGCWLGLVRAQSFPSASLEPETAGGAVSSSKKTESLTLPSAVGSISWVGFFWDGKGLRSPGVLGFQH